MSADPDKADLARDYPALLGCVVAVSYTATDPYVENEKLQCD
jgi:hypothetical protein